MNKTVVALLGLALLVAPALPGLAQGQGNSEEVDDGGETSGEQGEDRPSAACPEGFAGDHWRMGLDAELPGARNVTLAASNATLAEQIRLPGDDLTCDVREDRVRLFTGVGQLQARDRAELPLTIGADDEEAAELVLAPDVEIEATEDGYHLRPAEGPTLSLEGDELVREDRTISIGDDAEIATARPAGDDADRGEDPTSAEGEAGSEDRDERSQREASPGRDRGGPDGGDERPQQRDRSPVTEANYSVGAVELRLDGDELRNVAWRNVTLFRSIDVPGLTPAEERHHGPQLRLDGEDARVHIVAAGGLMARMGADEGLVAEVGQDVEMREDDEAVYLSTDNLLVVLEGDELERTGRTVSADEIELHARSPQHHEGAVWEPEGPSVLGLPHDYQGRHVAFDLAGDRIGNLTLHGTPVGEITFDPVTVDEVDRRGANFEAEGEDFELRVQDTPAVQLRLEATNLSADLSERTTLPSGAQVHVDVEDDELRLRVDRPSDALANRTIAEHQAPSAPVERTEGPAPGLATEDEQGRLGIESESPNTITTSFSNRTDDLDANVSVELGLARAMLVDDTNGNSRVDVGEPALAERPLANGSVAVEDDQLVHRFPLWSGNLTVTVEPGEDTAKVTYVATNLSAPPGTLFVLETNVVAPPDANLTPTDTGVVVENGIMQAEYSATGPVTVDGEEAWAQRSIFVDGDDRVRVLTAYPAGDNVTHDPTVAVQSTASDVAERVAASPYAVVVGAGLAGLLVAGTVIHRRRQRI
jgi:hypothetical protein